MTSYYIVYNNIEQFFHGNKRNEAFSTFKICFLSKNYSEQHNLFAPFFFFDFHSI